MRAFAFPGGFSSLPCLKAWPLGLREKQCCPRYRQSDRLVFCSSPMTALHGAFHDEVDPVRNDVKTSRIQALSPLRGKDPSKTRGEQTAINFETLFWTPVWEKRPAQCRLGRSAGDRRFLLHFGDD